MDPCTFIGTLSAAGTIIAGITTVAHKISRLRGRFREADTTLALLIVELSAIKGALSQVEDWVNFNFLENPVQEELAESFSLSLEGCRTAVGLLDDEIAELMEAWPDNDDDFSARARAVWNESGMKDHQQKLHGQILALQLLLQAVNIRSLPGQAGFMREPSNRKIIEKMKDDTSSLRAIARSSRSGATSIITRTESSIGSTVFRFDKEMLDTVPYRNNGSQARLRHDANKERRERSVSRSNETASPTNSSLASPIITIQDANSSRTTLSPEPSVGQPWTRPEPYQASTYSDSVGRRSPVGSPQVRQGAFSDLPRGLGLQIPFRGRPNEDSVRWWAKMRGSRSRSNISLSTGSVPRVGGAMSPSAGARRGRRRSEGDVNQSVDFSQEKSPPIIRAAQDGSGHEVEDCIDQGANIEETTSVTKRTALAVAAHCGNDDVVAILLQHGAKMDVSDLAGMMPLHLAASRGHYMVVEQLLNESCAVDCLTKDLKTPLRLACDNGYHEVAQTLLESGARVNSRDRHQLTALHAAAKLGDGEMVNLLIANHADVDARDAHTMAAIHYAAEGGHNDIIEALLNKKVHVNYTGKSSMTPLMFACSSGRAEVVKALLKRKASVKHKSDGDMTALHWACYHGHTEIVDHLVQKRAALDAKTIDLRTPLHVAVLSRNFATIEYLLRKNAPIEAWCANLRRPLHYACETGDADIVRLLLSFKADVEAMNSEGQRPLHVAATHGSTAVVDMLVSKNVSIDSRDHNGERPLCLACMHGHLDIVIFLLNRGSAVRLKFADGQSHEDSPLCIAAKHGHLPIVLELISRGASVKQRDEKNWQPLRYAAYHGHPDIAEVLLVHGASVSALSTGTFGFNVTVGRIGFANDVTQDRQKQVLELLQVAETTERSEQEVREAREAETAAPPMQYGVAEKDDDIDDVESIQALASEMPSRPAPPVPNSVADIAALSSRLSSIGLSRSSNGSSSGRWPISREGSTSGPSAHGRPSPMYFRPSMISRSATRASPSAVSTNRGSITPPLRPSAPPPPTPFHRPETPPPDISEEDKARARSLTCESCRDAGNEIPDFTCKGCRQIVFMFSYGHSEQPVATGAVTYPFGVSELSASSTDHALY